MIKKLALAIGIAVLSTLALTAAQNRGPIAVGTAAPEFSLKDLEGKVVSDKQLGGKVVVLDFWATWCGPCKQTLPHTQALAVSPEAKSGQLAVIAVNLREDRQKVANFMKQNGYSFRVALDEKGSVGTAYNVSGIPAFVVIDRKGKVAFSTSGLGEAKKKEMDQVIRTSLAQRR